MRRIMKNMVVALLATFGGATAMAQEADAPQGKLEVYGAWQLCRVAQSDSGQIEFHLAPVMKVLTKEGSFQDILIKATGGGSVVMNYGTFKLANDSVLELTPDAALPQVGEGTGNTVTFHLQGPQWMVIDAKSPRSGEPEQQVWMRARVINNPMELMKEFEQPGRPNFGGGRPRDGRGPQQGQGRGRGQNRGQGNIQQNNTQMNLDTDRSWMDED